MLLGVLSPRSEQNREERPRQTLQEGKACRVRSVSRCWPWQSQLAAGTIAETAREEKNKISTLNRDGLGRWREAREIWAGGLACVWGRIQTSAPRPPARRAPRTPVRSRSLLGGLCSALGAHAPSAAAREGPLCALGSLSTSGLAGAAWRKHLYEIVHIK